MMEERKNGTPEILSAKDLQDMGFSRSMSYALFNREDIPVIRIGKRKFIRRERFMEWLAEQEMLNIPKGHRKTQSNKP